VNTPLQNEIGKKYPSIEHLIIGNTIPDIVHARKYALNELKNANIPNAKIPLWRYSQCNDAFDKKYALLRKEILESELLEKTSHRFKDTMLLFFINGVLCEKYCKNIEDTTVSIQTFEQLEENQPQLLTELILSSFQKENIFSLMNFTLLSQGSLIIIPSYYKSNIPIVIFNAVINNTKISSMLHSQLHLVVEKNANAQILEYQHISSKCPMLTNFETNIRCNEHCFLEYNYLSQNSTLSTNSSRRQIHQYSNSACTTRDLLIGGKYHRHQSHYYLHSEQTSTQTFGLMLPKKDGVHDLINGLEHHVAQGSSHQLIKSLIPNYGHAAFTGNIRVNKDAVNTDAKMDCHHLMLGNLGKADSSPQFEIFTDDVQCNHSASISQLNEEALFYLASRGVPDNFGKILLTKSFITEWMNSPDQILSNFFKELVEEECNKIFRGL